VHIQFYFGDEVAVVDGLAGGADDVLRFSGGHQPLPAPPAAHVLHSLLRGPRSVSVPVQSSPVQSSSIQSNPIPYTAHRITGEEENTSRKREREGGTYKKM
jgi:hypothetical protein